MIAPDATERTVNKSLHVWKRQRGEERGRKKREEGGWAWWLLSDSQEWFSPSIGVLKAPWIINGLSLRCQPPLVLRFLLVSLHSLFSPSLPPSTLQFLPSLLRPLCVFPSTSSLPHCLTFCRRLPSSFLPYSFLHSHSSTFSSPSTRRCLICFSLSPLFSISASISSSSPLTSVHSRLSSSLYLPLHGLLCNTGLRLIFGPSSLFSPFFFAATSTVHLYSSSPHISLSLVYIPVSFCAFVQLSHS